MSDSIEMKLPEDIRFAASLLGVLDVLVSEEYDYLTCGKTRIDIGQLRESLSSLVSRTEQPKGQKTIEEVLTQYICTGKRSDDPHYEAWVSMDQLVNALAAALPTEHPVCAECGQADEPGIPEHVYHHARYGHKFKAAEQSKSDGSILAAFAERFGVSELQVEKALNACGATLQAQREVKEIALLEASVEHASGHENTRSAWSFRKGALWMARQTDTVVSPMTAGESLRRDGGDTDA